jgi:hypothetical protein
MGAGYQRKKHSVSFGRLSEGEGTSTLVGRRHSKVGCLCKACMHSYARSERVAFDGKQCVY